MRAPLSPFRLRKVLDMQDDDRAYRVGEALAYLVRRMETFCTTQDGDVVMYKPRDRSRIPGRRPAVEVLNGQARNYSRHRELYPEDHRVILDGCVDGLLADPENAAKACEGFVSALSKPGYLGGRMFGNDC
jgi:hypothetical protein